jgi:predicted O-linked N-acetylglucosamine transferase (SPINDLY family)
LPRVEDHLARYRLADVFLDTYPYNGHTTAGDALRAGIPVVSLYGESFASRVALSLLHDLELQQNTCQTIGGYHITALKIALNSEERRINKANLNNKFIDGIWPPSDNSQALAMLSALTELSSI